MIKIRITIKGGPEQVAPGVSSFVFPAVHEIVCRDWEVFNKTLVLSGAFKGDAHVIFDTRNISEFEIFDAATGECERTYVRLWDLETPTFQLVTKKFDRSGAVQNI